MAKLAQNYAKYLIEAKMYAKALVEKPDVIGAIFGQTEGLLGPELDLRELQQTGRLGRIEVQIYSSNGKSTANITIPSSMDIVETCLIAASMETVDKIGPCDARIEVIKVEDVRMQKRKHIIEKSKELLKKTIDSTYLDSQRVIEEIKESVRTMEAINYHGSAAGPEIETSDEIIIVEGRADVLNLLRNGIKNAIAIQGSKMPDSVIELTKEKITTAFLDGDRGGDLDLKKLLSVADIDYVARAEHGKEVEDLSKKQIFKALRDRIPASEIVDAPKHQTIETNHDINKYKSVLDDIVGTRAVCLLSKTDNIINKVPISELPSIMPKNVYAIVLDAKVNQDIVNFASKHDVKYIVGMGYSERVRAGNIKILTYNDFK